MTAWADEEYTEINMGAVNRFDWDKLLPSTTTSSSLAARTAGDEVGHGGSDNMQRLSAGMELLGRDDGFYGELPGWTGRGSVRGGGGTPRRYWR